MNEQPQKRTPRSCGKSPAYLLPASCLCIPASELLAMPALGSAPSDWAQKVAAMAPTQIPVPFSFFTAMQTDSLLSMWHLAPLTAASTNVHWPRPLTADSSALRRECGQRSAHSPLPALYLLV